MYPTLVVMIATAQASIVERSAHLASRASALDIVIPVIASTHQERPTHASLHENRPSRSFLEPRYEQKIENFHVPGVDAPFTRDTFTTIPDGIVQNDSVV